jgi:2-hydroxy-6-oxonona-2,4-dienedioate hydrolase
LHGTGGHLEAFAYNLVALGSTHRVIAFDLPAHGWSGAPERSYEIDGYCDHLEALFDLYGIQSAVLVGSSLGGWIAATFALTRPARVEAIVLVDSGGTTEDPARMERLYSMSMAAVSHPDAHSIRQRLEFVVARRESLPEELVACRAAIYSRPGAEAAMRRALLLQTTEARRRNLFTKWAQLRQPALVVWGRQDDVIPLAAGEAIAGAISGARLEVLDDCGHWPQFEHALRFNKIVAEFLSELH